MSSFPDMAPLVAELQNSRPDGSMQKTTFNVTSQEPKGGLIIKESFFEQFGEMEEFMELVAAHNAKYNPQGVRLKDTMASPRRPEPVEQPKTVVIPTDEPLTVEKLVALPNTSWPQLGFARVGSTHHIGIS